jgi:hypothetical protein
MRVVVLLVLVNTAHARPIHGSVGIGGSFLTTGNDGDAARGELEVDLEPDSRYGALLALRGVAQHHHGLLMAGLIYEAAAARPTLVLDLHADAGADLDHRAPLVGGGLRATLGLLGPIGVALDTGGYLVIDGVDHTRLVLSTSVSIVAAW